ncbi:MAG TPA: transcriptional regulator [Selenomonas sp.]|nr:transcriptional regulator [Selenomonas sp.]
MSNLQKLPPTLDSREVAKMVGMRHADLMRNIDHYIEVMGQNAKLRSDDFFIKQTYTAGTGKQYKRYDITKQGCEMVANKLTGEKGILFTAEYVKRFNEMEQAIKTPQLTPNPHYRTRMIGTAVRDIGKTAEALEKVFGCRHGMALATASSMVGEAYGIDTKAIAPLIPAEDSPCTMKVASIAEALGFFYKKSGNPDSQKVNRLLQSCGLQDKPRDSKGAVLKNTDWVLTDEGKAYGESVAFTDPDTGHHGYRIVWNADVLELLRKALN